MKKLLYILLAILIFASCDDSAPSNPTPEPEVCPAPVEIPGIGIHVPLAHSLQDVSINQELLAYKNDKNTLKVLNLKSGAIKEHDLQDYLPENVVLESIMKILWSPYDNHRILIQAITRTDTSQNGLKYELGNNLYFFDIKQVTLENISPSDWGPIGWKAYLSIGYYMPLEWLGFSHSGKDIFVIDRKIYHLQEDKLIDNSSQIWNDIFFSDDAKYSLMWLTSPPQTQSYIMSIYDGSNLNKNVEYRLLYDNFSRAFKICWSPNNKYMAISGRWVVSDEPINSRRYFEIWIIDFKQLLIDTEKNGYASLSLTNVSNVINLRFKYCKYAFSKDRDYSIMDTEFISDTTMAVSMHEDGAEYSYLYEISIHGEMIRQLTFEP